MNNSKNNKPKTILILKNFSVNGQIVRRDQRYIYVCAGGWGRVNRGAVKTGDVNSQRVCIHISVKIIQTHGAFKYTVGSASEQGFSTSVLMMFGADNYLAGGSLYVIRYLVMSLVSIQ